MNDGFRKHVTDCTVNDEMCYFIGPYSWTRMMSRTQLVNAV